MWIASPAADDEMVIILMNTYEKFISGEIYNSYYSSLWGLRPIVCLNSDVILEKGSGDNFFIK